MNLHECIKKILQEFTREARKRASYVFNKMNNLEIIKCCLDTLSDHEKKTYRKICVSTGFHHFSLLSDIFKEGEFNFNCPLYSYILRTKDTSGIIECGVMNNRETYRHIEDLTTLDFYFENSNDILRFINSCVDDDNFKDLQEVISKIPKSFRTHGLRYSILSSSKNKLKFIEMFLENDGAYSWASISNDKPLPFLFQLIRYYTDYSSKSKPITDLDKIIEILIKHYIKCRQDTNQFKIEIKDRIKKSFVDNFNLNKSWNNHLELINTLWKNPSIYFIDDNFIYNLIVNGCEISFPHSIVANAKDLMILKIKRFIESYFNFQTIDRLNLLYKLNSFLTEEESKRYLYENQSILLLNLINSKIEDMEILKKKTFNTINKMTNSNDDVSKYIFQFVC